MKQRKNEGLSNEEWQLLRRENIIRDAASAFQYSGDPDLVVLGKIIRAWGASERAEVERELRGLVTFVVEASGDLLITMRENQERMYGASFVVAVEEADATQPFFSEAVLYPLIGKEDARSVLGRMENLCRRLGFDLDQLQGPPYAS